MAVFFMGDGEPCCREADEYDLGVDGGVESIEVNAGEGGRCVGTAVGLGGKTRGLGRLRMKRGDGAGDSGSEDSIVDTDFVCEALLLARRGGEAFIEW